MKQSRKYRKWKNPTVLHSLYWDKYLSQLKIAQLLGCSKRNIEVWMKKLKIPTRDRGSAISLGYVRPKLNLSKSLTYILGVLLGDGYITIYKRKDGARYKVGLNVKDKIFAIRFLNALKEINLKPNLCQDAKLLYRVGAYSKIFVEWFKNLNLTRIEHLVDKKKCYMISFLRGFYESEGYYNSNNKTISISNTDKEILKLVSKFLSKLNIFSKIYGPYKKENGWRDEYCLVITKRKDSKRFLRLIKSCIKY